MNTQGICIDLLVLRKEDFEKITNLQQFQTNKQPDAARGLAEMIAPESKFLQSNIQRTVLDLNTTNFASLKHLCG